MKAWFAGVVAALVFCSPPVGHAEARGTLTFEQIENLPQDELVAAIFAQFAAEVVHVDRPDLSGVYNADGTSQDGKRLAMMLRPQAAPGLRGVCEVAFLNVHLRDDRANAYAARRIARRVQYKVVGEVEKVRRGRGGDTAVDPETQALCVKLDRPEGLVNAEDALDIWLAAELLRQAAQGLRKKSADFAVECGDYPDCASRIAGLVPEDLVFASDCPASGGLFCHTVTTADRRIVEFRIAVAFDPEMRLSLREVRYSDEVVAIE